MRFATTVSMVRRRALTPRLGDIGVGRRLAPGRGVAAREVLKVAFGGGIAAHLQAGGPGRDPDLAAEARLAANGEARPAAVLRDGD